MSDEVKPTQVVNEGATQEVAQQYKPPNWVVIPIEVLADEPVDCDRDRLKDMAAVLTHIMYVLMDAESSTVYSQENGNG